MTFEEQIRDVIARGDFTHLSVIPSDGVFAATFTPAKEFACYRATDADPVKAMQAAMSAAKLARKPRATVEPPPARVTDDLDFG